MKFYLVNPNTINTVEEIEADSFTQAFREFKKGYCGTWRLYRGEGHECSIVNLDAPYQRNFKYGDEILETWEKAVK